MNVPFTDTNQRADGEPLHPSCNIHPPKSTEEDSVDIGVNVYPLYFPSKKPLILSVQLIKTINGHHFQLSGVVIDVESSSDTWGKNQAIIATLTALLEALAYLDRAYYFFIGKTVWFVERLSRGTPEHGEYRAVLPKYEYEYHCCRLF